MRETQSREEQSEREPKEGRSFKFKEGERKYERAQSVEERKERECKVGRRRREIERARLGGEEEKRTQTGKQGSERDPK